MIIHNDINKFIDMKPSFYRFLKIINIARDITAHSCTRYDIEIVLSKILNEEIEDLRIRCVGAVDIKIRNIENLFGMRLEIEDISDWQHEGVSYRISEQENNTFSFNCHEFYAEQLPRPMEEIDRVRSD